MFYTLCTCVMGYLFITYSKQQKYSPTIHKTMKFWGEISARESRWWLKIKGKFSIKAEYQWTCDFKQILHN